MCRDDVAALYAYPHNTAFNVFAGTPTGLASSWERRWISSDNGWDWSKTKLATGDFNGDGRDDVAALYAYPHNTAFNVFAGTPTGLASSWERRWISSDNGWDSRKTKLATGDFNGDGRDDVAALYAYPHNTAFNVFAGTPTGLASSWERRWISSDNGWDWSKTR